MNNESFEKYNAGTHILGRIFSVITLVLDRKSTRLNSSHVR